MTIHEMYQARFDRPQDFEHCHDIAGQLPILRRLASNCRHVTELGTRTGNSTCALLAGLAENGRGKGILHSYDINPTPFKPPHIEGVTWVFHQHDTGKRDFEIETTDLLFLDSLHEYDHILRELRHEASVFKKIVFHDTALDWVRLGGRGVLDAITAFLVRNPQWKVGEVSETGNGLTVLHREGA